MSEGGNSSVGGLGTRRLMWHALACAARRAALPCSLPCPQPEPYDPHAAGGAP
jgi:hypothetical protein